MDPEFPSFDVPAEVQRTPSATPTAEPQPAAAADPSPTPAAPATPEAPPPSDPLFAPWSSQQAPEPPAAPAAPAEPAAPAAPVAPEPTPTELLLAQQSQLLAALAQQITKPAAATPDAPAAPARDPKDIELEQALIKRVPALGALIQIMGDPAKAAAFQTLIDAAPQHQQTVQAFYENYAEQTVGKLRGFYADAYGVDAAAVTREHEDMLSDQFALWIEKPQNAKALQRYEAGDIRVVDEFANFFRQRFVAPARRQGQVAVTQRAAAVADLPRGGGSTIPTPQQSAPPVQTPAGERDVFGEAWGELSRARAAG